MVRLCHTVPGALAGAFSLLLMISVPAHWWLGLVPMGLLAGGLAGAAVGRWLPVLPAQSARDLPQALKAGALMGAWGGFAGALGSWTALTVVNLLLRALGQGSLP